MRKSYAHLSSRLTRANQVQKCCRIFPPPPKSPPQGDGVSAYGTSQGLQPLDRKEGRVPFGTLGHAKLAGTPRTQFIPLRLSGNPVPDRPRSLRFLGLSLEAHADRRCVQPLKLKLHGTATKLSFKCRAIKYQNHRLRTMTPLRLGRHCPSVLVNLGPCV